MNETLAVEFTKVTDSLEEQDINGYKVGFKLTKV